MVKTFSMFSCAAALAALVVLSPGATETAQAAKKKRTSEHLIHGKVVSISPGTNGTGTITIKVHHHKKHSKNAVAAVAPAPVAVAGKHHHHREYHTFQVGPNTAVVSVLGKSHKPTTLAAIHKGEHVAIRAAGKDAEKINIIHHKHKKKGKKVASAGIAAWLKPELV